MFTVPIDLRKKISSSDWTNNRLNMTVKSKGNKG
jgi:hypothetical protein